MDDGDISYIKNVIRERNQRTLDLENQVGELEDRVMALEAENAALKEKRCETCGSAHLYQFNEAGEMNCDFGDICAPNGFSHWEPKEVGRGN